MNELIIKLVDEFNLSNGYKEILLEQITQEVIDKYNIYENNNNNNNNNNGPSDKFRTDDRVIDAEELYYMI